MCCQFRAEELFFSGISGIKNKVIDVDANAQGLAGGRRAGTIDDARVETGIVWRWLDFHLLENGGEEIVPVMMGTAYAVEGLVQEPHFIFLVGWVSDRRLDDHTFIIWELGIAKGIFTIALFFNAPPFDSHRRQEKRARFL